MIEMDVISKPLYCLAVELNNRALVRNFIIKMTYYHYCQNNFCFYHYSYHYSYHYYLNSYNH